jgi:hypothetical protein
MVDGVIARILVGWFCLWLLDDIYWHLCLRIIHVDIRSCELL